jgi:molybdenum cofactor biosynthesis enzyme
LNASESFSSLRSYSSDSRSKSTDPKFVNFRQVNDRSLSCLLSRKTRPIVSGAASGLRECKFRSYSTGTSRQPLAAFSNVHNDSAIQLDTPSGLSYTPSSKFERPGSNLEYSQNLGSYNAVIEELEKAKETYKAFLSNSRYFQKQNSTEERELAERVRSAWIAVRPYEVWLQNAVTMGTHFTGSRSVKLQPEESNSSNREDSTTVFVRRVTGRTEQPEKAILGPNKPVGSQPTWGQTVKGLTHTIKEKVDSPAQHVNSNPISDEPQKPVRLVKDRISSKKMSDSKFKEEYRLRYQETSNQAFKKITINKNATGASEVQEISTDNSPLSLQTSSNKGFLTPMTGSVSATEAGYSRNSLAPLELATSAEGGTNSVDQPRSLVPTWGQGFSKAPSSTVSTHHNPSDTEPSLGSGPKASLTVMAVSRASAIRRYQINTNKSNGLSANLSSVKISKDVEAGPQLQNSLPFPRHSQEAAPNATQSDISSQPSSSTAFSPAELEKIAAVDRAMLSVRKTLFRLQSMKHALEKKNPSRTALGPSRRVIAINPHLRNKEGFHTSSIPSYSALRLFSTSSASYYESQAPKLTHLTSSGTAHMVSIKDKEITARQAVAVCSVIFSNETPLSLIKANQIKKGDVLGVARVAGIMAAKRTSDLIPLCHPIAITQVTIELGVIDPVAPTNDELETGTIEEKSSPWAGTGQGDAYSFHTQSSAMTQGNPRPQFGSIEIAATVSCDGKTGVEMEALTAASTAALTVYDMCKAVDKGMRIEGMRVVKKEGGKSGTWIEDP